MHRIVNPMRRYLVLDPALECGVDGVRYPGIGGKNPDNSGRQGQREWNRFHSKESHARRILHSPKVNWGWGNGSHTIRANFYFPDSWITQVDKVEFYIFLPKSMQIPLSSCISPEV